MSDFLCETEKASDTPQIGGIRKTTFAAINWGVTLIGDFEIGKRLSSVREIPPPVLSVTTFTKKRLDFKDCRKDFFPKIPRKPSFSFAKEDLSDCARGKMGGGVGGGVTV